MSARTALVTDRARCSSCGWRPPRQVDVIATPELAHSVALVVKLVCPTPGCREALTLTYPALPCPNHPPPETLEAIECVRCGASKQPGGKLQFFKPRGNQ